MKKNKIRWGVISFFLLTAFTVTVAVMIYGAVDSYSGGDVTTIMLVMWVVVLFLSLLFTVIDYLRRKRTVVEPTEKILEAVEKIASGDFSTRIIISKDKKKYNEYDRIAQSINLLAQHVSRSAIMKTDFISNISHELKTPLAVIRSYAALIKDGGLDEEASAQYAQTIVSAAEKLSALVSDVLRLNKLEKGGVMPEKERVDIESLIGEIIINYESKIEDKNLEIECDLCDLYLISYPSYLEIVFSNLISNAVKFTSCGGRISIKGKREENGIAVSVKDSGCGISKEDGKRIFEKFYQADTSHSGEGNGLGLALVKRVVDIIGGSISVESEEGVGSTFTVKITEEQ